MMKNSLKYTALLFHQKLAVRERNQEKAVQNKVIASSSICTYYMYIPYVQHAQYATSQCTI